MDGRLLHVGGRQGKGLPNKGDVCGLHAQLGADDQIAAAIDVTGKLVWTHGIDKRLGTTRIDYLSVVFPINATYNFKPFGGLVKLSPFLGPTFKFNIVGSRRTVGGLRTNYLSREEAHPAKILQVGLDVGVGLTYKRYYFAYTLQPDIVPYLKEKTYTTLKLRPINHSLLLGYEF